MSTPVSAVEHQPGEVRHSLFGRWHHTPLYLRIIGALILGVITGVLLGQMGDQGGRIASNLAVPSKLVLRLLGALAPPLILVAIIHALMTAEIGGRTAGRLLRLLVLNTIVAICIGLLVANVVRPGQWSNITPQAVSEGQNEGPKDILTQFLDNVQIGR